MCDIDGIITLPRGILFFEQARSEMVPDTPERVPEMQDTPPCRLFKVYG